MATQYLQCKRVRDFHTCRDRPRLPLSGADAVSLFLLLWFHCHYASIMKL